ncbi:hypothetical protein KBZ21_28225, partial [Streptomyces sp. A73]|nr:hypothetical protein [Streptomyces sp. A73]
HHRAGTSARRRCPHRFTVGSRLEGDAAAQHQGETAWQSLVARLVEVVQEVRAWAARGAG